MKLRHFVLVASFWVSPAFQAQAQTIMFDFDTGTPALSVGQTVPLDQTSGGVTAHLSSPSGAAFSIQTDSSTSFRLSQFSGHYLYDNNQNKNALDIAFSQNVLGVTFTFATADFQQVEIPTTIQLTAYLDSNGTRRTVGSATAHGTYASDTMPMGKLSYSSGGQPFNLVEISIPFQPLGAAAYFVDNVAVTMGQPAFTNVSWASYTGPLAANSVVSAFGRNLAPGTETASSQPPPNTLANTIVKVKDATGIERQAPLYYVGPTQINYLVPDGTAVGQVAITVVSGGQVTATGTASVDIIAPGLVTANQDGAGVPLAQAISLATDQTMTAPAVFSCGAAQGSCVPVPVDLGPSGTEVVLVLYGTGIRGRSSLAGVTANIGGSLAPVLYAGAQPQYAGLDQVNVRIPGGLAGRGDVNLVLTVDGRAANTVMINLK